MYTEKRDEKGVLLGVSYDHGYIPVGVHGWDDYLVWLSKGNIPLSDPERTPEKIAERAAEAQAQADRRNKIITEVSGLMDAQIDSYIDTNVTNLAGAVTFLKRLTKVIRALAIESGVR